MVIHIRPNKLIGDLQQEFNGMFPFLKLEFFRENGHAEMMPSKKRIADIQLAITDGDIEVDPAMSVKELEQRFKNDYSLQVQVFRRSGKIWLQTSMTDGWTLSHQNTHGQEISEDKVQTNAPKDVDLFRDNAH